MMDGQMDNEQPPNLEEWQIINTLLSKIINWLLKNSPIELLLISSLDAFTIIIHFALCL